MSALLTFVSGVVSGLISSLVFFIITKSVKARLLIADNIKVEKMPNNQNLYVVKIANRSRADLINLQYCLDYCEVTYQNGPSVQMTEISPAKGKLFLIPAYNKNAKHNEYAVQISFIVDNNKFPIDNNHYLMFSITAEHSTFGTSRNATKKYYSNMVKEGEFEQGLSMEIR